MNKTVRIDLMQKPKVHSVQPILPKKPERVYSGSVFYLCPYCRANVHTPYAGVCPECKLRFNAPIKQVFDTQIDPETYKKINPPLPQGQRPFLGPTGKKILRYKKETLGEVIDTLIKS